MAASFITSQYFQTIAEPSARLRHAFVPLFVLFDMTNVKQVNLLCKICKKKIKNLNKFKLNALNVE